MNKIFINNEYKVLETMHNNIITVSDEEYCPMGQGDIAKKLGISRAVSNKIFVELKENGYISMITRGKWKLSDKAINLINVTKEL